MTERNIFGMEFAMVVLTLGTIALLALGQVLFKLAAGSIQLSDPRSLVSLPLFIALTIYGLATVMWLVVLSKVPLSTAFPFYSLTFLLVPLLAWLVLKEPIRPQVMIGGVVIMVGIVISTVGMPKH
jgi:drug/metabolite transporter (DMT)-like permease